MDFLNRGAEIWSQAEVMHSKGESRDHAKQPTQLPTHECTFGT